LFKNIVDEKPDFCTVVFSVLFVSCKTNDPALEYKYNTILHTAGDMPSFTDPIIRNI